MKLRIGLLVIAIYSCFAEEIRVAPDYNATNCSTCITLTNCAKQKNCTNHTTFILLSGIHILEADFTISGLVNVSFSGENVTIHCGYKFGFAFENISGLMIEGISFVSCGNLINPGLLISYVQYGTFSDIIVMNSTYTAVNIKDSMDIKILNLLVTNNKLLHEHNSAIVLFQNSHVNFRGTTTFSDNILSKNNSSPEKIIPTCSTPSYGTAVLLAEGCHVFIYGNFTVFNNTSPTAIIRINEESLQIIGTSDFKQNSVGIYGVLSLFNSRASISGPSNFSLNAATSKNVMQFKTVAGIYISCSTLNVTDHIEFNSNIAGVSSCSALNSIVLMNKTVLCKDNHPPANPVNSTLFRKIQPQGLCTSEDSSYDSVIKLYNTSFTIVHSEFNRNQDSFVIQASQSQMFFDKENSFVGNTHLITSRSSTLKFFGRLSLLNNSAGPTSTYSAINLNDQSRLVINGTFLVKGNTRSNAKGGVVFAQARSELVFGGAGTFERNLARLGGVFYLQDDSFITLLPFTQISFVENFAEKGGGVIYLSRFYSFCDYGRFSAQLPCFLRHNDSNNHTIILSGNRAGDGTGSVLHSNVQTGLENNTNTFNNIIFLDFNSTYDQDHPLLSSEFYRLYFCENDAISNYNTRNTSRKFRRGETFKVKVAAIAFAGGSGTQNLVRSYFTNPSITTDRLFSRESQWASDNCSTELTFEVFSPESFEEIAITATGYCNNDVYCLRLNLTFEECQDGFQLATNRCVCDSRIQTYNTTCNVNNGEITKTLKNPWIGASYQNSSDSNSTFQGLILYHNCPFNYCRIPVKNINEVALKLSDPDVQCSKNRGGLLCGACKGNTSLKLHSLKCDDCSDNSAFAVIIPMFALGILFIAFLSLVQFTVSSGTVHGLLFYANIISANTLMLGTHAFDGVKFFDVFIAWVNLDFGFNVCFHDGLNQLGYISWQFVFPLYLCAIVLTISIICHYSIKASCFFAKIHDPVAVLETVLLFSYCKFIRNVIDILSPAHLEYPDNTCTVWLRDGTVPFGTDGRHAVLVIIAIVLGAIMILGTIVLFLSQWLYKSETISKLFNRYHITASLNTYHAAFKPESRYWVSLCNLLRWVLMLTFALDEDFNVSLLAVCTVCTLLLSIISVSGGIYNSRWLDLLEVSFIVNLLLYSVGIYHARATLGGPSVVLTYLSTGLAFLIFVFVVCVLIYKRLCIKKNLELLKKRFKKQVNVSESLESVLVASQDNAVESKQHTSRTYHLMRFSKLRETLLEESV